MNIYRLYVVNDRREFVQSKVTNVQIEARSIHCNYGSYYLYAFNSINRDREAIFLDEKMMTPYFKRLKSYLLRKIDNEIIEVKNRYENVKKLELKRI